MSREKHDYSRWDRFCQSEFLIFIQTPWMRHLNWGIFLLYHVFVAVVQWWWTSPTLPSLISSAVVRSELWVSLKEQKWDFVFLQQMIKVCVRVSVPRVHLLPATCVSFCVCVSSIYIIVTLPGSSDRCQPVCVCVWGGERLPAVPTVLILKAAITFSLHHFPTENIKHMFAVNNPAFTHTPAPKSHS